MKITDLPFNRMLGLNVSDDAGCILYLSDSPDYTNHLGTVHASALFSLAEATSGHFLISHFSEFGSALVPVVRRAEIKFKRPANGKVCSIARLVDSTIDEIKEQLSTRKRASIKIEVELLDARKASVMAGNFEWFLTMIEINN